MVKPVLPLVLILMSTSLLGCAHSNISSSQIPHSTPTPLSTQQPSAMEQTIETGLIKDQVIESDLGEIHYSYYLPNDYDPNHTYPLMMSMPGYDMMWFGEASQGNQNEWIGFTSWFDQEPEMIVVCAQLLDWQENSANQINWLCQYFIDHYSIDHNRIYACGYSAGGETMSQAVSLRPDLYAAYLHASSQWDGSYQPLIDHQVAVYIFMAQDDEYYGVDKAIDAYTNLTTAYQESGYDQTMIDTLVHLNTPDQTWFDQYDIHSNYHAGGNVLFNDPTIHQWILAHHQ